MKKTTNKVETIKVNTQELNAIAKGVTKNLNNNKRELKNERKTLKQTMRFLLNSETEAGKTFRAFFDLNSKSNKDALKTAIAYVEKNYIYALEMWQMNASECGEEVTPEFIKLVPCSKNGKEKKDYVDVITDVIKKASVNVPKRVELGRQIKNLWSKKPTETDALQYAIALKNTFAPRLKQYQVKTQILGIKRV